MTSVKVYVYDLSQGLAKALSFQLIGQHLDGIWHTGIVVYGNEYFYGSNGIDMCPPGGTVLGAPLNIINLGHTEVPEDLFISYLTELSENAYRPEKYHLFDHNCNTFSDETAYFLTNQHIPAHITELPKSVASTPLGQMLRTFIDGMSNNGPSNFLNPLTVPTSNQETLGAEASHANLKPSSNSSSAKNTTIIDSILYNEKLSQSSHDHWTEIGNTAKSSLRDVFTYATTSSDLNWGLGPTHYALIGTELMSETPSDQLFILELFRVSLLRSEDVAIGMTVDRSRHWQLLVDHIRDQESSHPVDFMIALMKVACNCIGQLIRSDKQLSQSLKVSLLQFTVKVLDGSAEQLLYATQLSYGLTCSKLEVDDSTLGLGSILIHILCEADPSKSESAHRFAVKALANLCNDSEDIRQLAIVQGLDVGFVQGPDAERLQAVLKNHD